MGTDSAKLDGLTFSSTSSYRILSELGRGGMGIVYLAEKNCEGVIDHVVLKTLRSINEEQIGRMRNEANIATVLRHENIVKTYGLEAIPLALLPREFREAMRSVSSGPRFAEKGDLDTRPVYRPRLVPPRGALTSRSNTSLAIDANSSVTHEFPSASSSGTRTGLTDASERMYCLAMDYVEGTDLGRLFRAHLRAWLLVPPILSAFVMSRIARALAYAHQFIVHRDISPENILINTHGVAKLTDFGIAVAAGKQTALAGKIMYMAPEQLQGGEIDARSDIFCLGLVAYQMLTGISLFHPPQGSSMEEAVAAVATRMRTLTIPPPHAVRSDIPEIVSSIVMKMLHRDPAERYQNMEDVGSDIEKAYIRIFESDFKLLAQSDLRQLTFLEAADRPGRLQLRRLFSYDSFTRLGKNLIKETQRGTLMFRILEQQAEQAKPV